MGSRARFDNDRPQYIAIPLKDSNEDEVIEISVEDLPNGPEVLNILQTEQAQLLYWIQIALEYYRQGKYDDFMMLLESAGSQASLDYPTVMHDQMRALDILAAYNMQLGWRERKSKEKRGEYYNKATVLFNTADKIKMYEISHLTVRAWFYLFDKENRQSKLEMADTQFNFVIKQDPTNILALIGKAVIAFDKQDYKSAIYFYRKALKTKPDGIADLRVGLGYCFARIGKIEKAEVAFERAKEMDPLNVNAMAGLAILRINMGDTNNLTNAMNMLGAAYQIQPEHPVILVHLANHFFYKKDFARVEQLAWHALHVTECDQIKAEACFQLARLAHFLEDHEKAFKYYYQATQLNSSGMTLAYFGLGQLYIGRGELDQAIQSFETIIKRMPNNADSLKILGALYAHCDSEDTQMKQKARETLQKALEARPEDVEILIDLAQLTESTEPQRSLEFYEKAIKMLKVNEGIDPQPEMLNNVGSLYMNMSQYDKARDTYIQAIARYEEMLSNGEKGDSEAEQHQLITIRYNLARCMEHQDQSMEAEEMYRGIIAAMPTYIDGYMRLGCLTRERGQIYDSSMWFKQAVPFDLGSQDAWTLIGNLHMARQEWQPAQKKFEHILNKLPAGKHDPYSLVALGNVWLEQLMNPARRREDEKKYFERAMSMYMKALNQQPKNYMAANGIGCILAFKKNWAEARDVFSQVREATSEFFDVWINIAHVYMEKEQYVPAIQMYMSAIKKFQRESDPSMLQYLAKAYYRADKLDEAKETLEKAILEAPDNLQLKFNYAFVLKRSARSVLNGSKNTTEEVQGAIEDLQLSARIYTYIAKNEDLSLPCAKFVSRTISQTETGECNDLLTQANTVLLRAKQRDEEERQLRAKQEEERQMLKQKLEQEALRKAEEARKKLEEARALRSTFVEMTKSMLRLPEVPEEKRAKKRRTAGGEGEEFVNDSSDMGDWQGEEGAEGGAPRRKKDKSSKKAARKRRERRIDDGSGSDGGGGGDQVDTPERKRKRKEAAERKAAAKLSAKQSAKIKSRAFLSSSEDSSDDASKRPKQKKSDDGEDDDDDDERPVRDEFGSSPEPPRIGGSDSDDGDARGASPSSPPATKSRRKKPVMDSDDSSGSEEKSIVGGSSDDEAPSPKKQPRKKRQLSSGSDVDSDDVDDVEEPSRKRKKKQVEDDDDDEEEGGQQREEEDEDEDGPSKGGNEDDDDVDDELQKHVAADSDDSD